MGEDLGAPSWCAKGATRACHAGTLRVGGRPRACRDRSIARRRLLLAFFRPAKKSLIFLLDTRCAFLAKRCLGKVFAKGYAKNERQEMSSRGRNQGRPKQ